MFDFDRYWSLIVSFLTTNVLIAAGLGVILLFALYKKPGGTIKFLGFGMLVVATLYVMSLLSESGSQGVIQKREMSTKSEAELGN